MLCRADDVLCDQPHAGGKLQNRFGFHDRSNHLVHLPIRHRILSHEAVISLCIFIPKIRMCFHCHHPLIQWFVQRLVKANNQVFEKPLFGGITLIEILPRMHHIPAFPASADFPEADECVFHHRVLPIMLYHASAHFARGKRKKLACSKDCGKNECVR